MNWCNGNVFGATTVVLLASVTLTAALHFLVLSQCRVARPWPSRYSQNELNTSKIIEESSSPGSEIVERLADTNLTIFILKSEAEFALESIVKSRLIQYNWKLTGIDDQHSYQEAQYYQHRLLHEKLVTIIITRKKINILPSNQPDENCSSVEMRNKRNFNTIILLDAFAELSLNVEENLDDLETTCSYNITFTNAEGRRHSPLSITLGNFPGDKVTTHKVEVLLCSQKRVFYVDKKVLVSVEEYDIEGDKDFQSNRVDDLSSSDFLLAEACTCHADEYYYTLKCINIVTTAPAFCTYRYIQKPHFKNVESL